MRKEVLQIKPLSEMIEDFLQKCRIHKKGLEDAAKKREAHPNWQKHFGKSEKKKR